MAKINQVSKRHLSYTSDGEALTQSVLNKRISEAKAQVLANQLDEFGYNFCKDCQDKADAQLLADEPITVRVNECLPIDCSHTIPVSECKDDGKAELAYDIKNIRPRGRSCHQILDKTNLQFTKHK